MTCQDILSCLDDLIDNELTPELTAEVREHIQNCEQCAKDYHKTVQLLKLLQATAGSGPGSDYWSDTTELIFARTIDASPDYSDGRNPIQCKELRQNALMRSVVSAVASLSILFSALLIGSQQMEQISRMEIMRSPVIATSDVRDLIGPNKTTIFTEKDQLQLTRGMFLLGAPGFLGRFAGLPDLIMGIE